MAEHLLNEAYVAVGRLQKCRCRSVSRCVRAAQVAEELEHLGVNTDAPAESGQGVASAVGGEPVVG